MGQRNAGDQRRSKSSRNSRNSTAPRAATEGFVRPAPKVFGPPITLLEDSRKVTFEYRNGSWVEFALTIAQCRLDGEVKELPQKINKMTRYQVRLPIPQ